MPGKLQYFSDHRFLNWGQSPFYPILVKHCLQMQGALNLTVLSAVNMLKLQERQRSFINLHKSTPPYLSLDKSGKYFDAPKILSMVAT